MRARVLLWLCLGLNILLAAMVVILARDSKHQFSLIELRPRAKEAQVKTNVVVRRQAFTWTEVESPDYRKYISNLRRIGCPQKTIRDIIVADVNDLYAERISKEIVFPEQKWWMPEPDLDTFQAGMDQLHALEAEKNRLLADLLGPDWAKIGGSVATIAGLEARESLYADALRFDGPILSKLSPEAKNNVRQIEQRAAEALEQIEQRASQENRQPSLSELAVLSQETRRQLGGILTGEQLEEYQLRYSQIAGQMRDQLRGFGASAEEFRRIFRVRDSYDQQLAAVDATDPTANGRRAEIERMRDEAMRQEIGSERFALYQMTQNPLFREAQQQAQQTGAPAEKVLPIFRINQAVQEEIARVQADRTISEDQRRIALVTIQQQQRNSIEKILANVPAEPVGPGESVPAVPRVPPFPPDAVVSQ
jgi:hypothetical protein